MTPLKHTAFAGSVLGAAIALSADSVAAPPMPPDCAPEAFHSCAELRSCYGGALPTYEECVDGQGAK